MYYYGIYRNIAPSAEYNATKYIIYGSLLIISDANGRKWFSKLQFFFKLYCPLFRKNREA